MPFYYQIDSTKESGRRTAANLLKLRERLEKEIPGRTRVNTLLLATWNIREFDSRSYGTRDEESLYYIAEIISRFDLVAIQEIREDLKALKRVRDILGGWWKFIVTDVTEGSRGNCERMGFLYDSRKVSFGGLAGELVLAPLKEKGKPYVPVLQFARSPYIAGFRAGWFSFMLCTVHILYGTKKAEDPQRVEELRKLAGFLNGRAHDPSAWSNNLILLGDFNIFDPDDITFKALTDQDFVIPPKIQKLPSNAPQSKHYDQIAFMLKRHMDLGKIKAGVFNFFEVVYREEDEKIYAGRIGKGYQVFSSGKKKGQKRTKKDKTGYYFKWRTYQMSDHLPMWVELPIEFGKEYLLAKSK